MKKTPSKTDVFGSLMGSTGAEKADAPPSRRDSTSALRLGPLSMRTQTPLVRSQSSLRKERTQKEEKIEALKSGHCGGGGVCAENSMLVSERAEDEETNAQRLMRISHVPLEDSLAAR